MLAAIVYIIVRYLFIAFAICFIRWSDDNFTAKHNRKQMMDATFACK